MSAVILTTARTHRILRSQSFDAWKTAAAASLPDAPTLVSCSAMGHQRDKPVERYRSGTAPRPVKTSVQELPAFFRHHTHGGMPRPRSATMLRWTFVPPAIVPKRTQEVEHRAAEGLLRQQSERLAVNAADPNHEETDPLAQHRRGKLDD